MSAPRRVLVSGAASGIGRATAERMRRAGAEVVAVDRADPGAAADRWLACDLADPPAVASLDLQGPFDALVNAAGLPPRPGEEARILAVNLFGLVALTRAVLPLMPAGGAIVSLASKAGGRWRENAAQVRRLMALSSPAGLPGFVAAEGIDPVRAYDLSKEAVIAWTKAQVRPMRARGLRANTLSPAAVETPILADFVRAFGERAVRGMAQVGRAGRPEEIAAVAAFLAGPDSGWMTGCDLQADGGLTSEREGDALDLPTGHGL